MTATFASFNVQTMDDVVDYRAVKATMALPGRRALVMSQCRAKGCSLVGLQETRASTATSMLTADYL
eukprot:2679469-Alexandrium_andersonii.AAC.1